MSEKSSCLLLIFRLTKDYVVYLFFLWEAILPKLQGCAQNSVQHTIHQHSTMPRKTELSVSLSYSRELCLPQCFPFWSIREVTAPKRVKLHLILSHRFCSHGLPHFTWHALSLPFLKFLLFPLQNGKTCSPFLKVGISLAPQGTCQICGSQLGICDLYLHH